MAKRLHHALSFAKRLFSRPKGAEQSAPFFICQSSLTGCRNALRGILVERTHENYQTMRQGNISVQTENIFPIIKKFLYSDHEIFLRELVSNAVDACQKAKTLSSLGELKEGAESYRVEVILNETEKTITICDNGVGMSEEEVDKYINQIAFSGAEEFVSKYKDAQIIGHFGLGFYSAFMVAKEVEIISKSRKDAPAVKWVCDGSPNFTMEAAEKETFGTDIILHIADDSTEFSEKSRLEGILNKYCRFMPVEIVFGTKTEYIDDPSGEKDDKGNVKRVETTVDNVINSTSPLWTKKPADLQQEDYDKFYRELYPYSFEDPLFHIHINVDYPFNLTGILFFPKLKANMENNRNKVQLYCNQVFITDEVKNILPDFLTLLHGVVDSPDIPLNVSRSYLQEDGNVKKISAHITKKVADKLNSMFNADRKDFEAKWDDISVFIHYGMLSEEKFNEKAVNFNLFKTTENEYFNLEELKTKVEGLQKDKNGSTVVLYSSDIQAQDSFIASAKDRGYVVVEMNSPLTPHLISQLESKDQNLKFKRVDSDVLDKLIEKEENTASLLTEEEKTALKPLFEENLDTKSFNVSFENMSSTEAPVTITQNEFMRRMKEQSALGGGGGMNFYGELPDSYTIVVNSNHPLMQKINADKEAGKGIAQQAVQLAMLSKGILKGAELTKFIQANFESLNK
jgi:molecular chaperone HtpG